MRACVAPPTDCMRRGASNGSSGATDVPWARLGRRLGDQRSGSTGVASVPTTGSRHRTPGIETGCTGHATCMERPRKAFATDLRGGSGLRPHCGGRHMARRQAAGASRLQSDRPARASADDEQCGRTSDPRPVSAWPSRDPYSAEADAVRFVPPVRSGWSHRYGEGNCRPHHLPVFASRRVRDRPDQRL